jgi:hypothetical protein
MHWHMVLTISVSVSGQYVALIAALCHCGTPLHNTAHLRMVVISCQARGRTENLYDACVYRREMENFVWVSKFGENVFGAHSVYGGEYRKLY